MLTLLLLMGWPPQEAGLFALAFYVGLFVLVGSDP